MNDKYEQEKWLAAEAAWEPYRGNHEKDDVWPVGVRIVHHYSYPEPPVVGIEVRCFTSGRTLYELRLSPEQFAAACVGNMEGTAGLVSPTDVGMRHEHETIEVIVPKAMEGKLYAFGSGGHVLTPEAEGLLRMYETDGWRISRSDFGNHHRSTKKGYMVTRHRFLPVTRTEARAAVFKGAE